MWRWSKIRDKHRPTIVEDYSNNLPEYTLGMYDLCGQIICDYSSRGSLVDTAKWGNSIIAYNSAIAGILYQDYDGCDAWEGHLGYDTFKKVIRDNVPCIKLHKVFDERITSKSFEVVMFLTGDWDDIFLVHPKDLTIWR